MNICDSFREFFCSRVALMSLANTRYRYYTKIVDFVNLNKTFSAVSEKFTLYANATLKISSAGVPNLKTTPAYIWT